MNKSTLKHERLGLITMLYLRYCGKRDCKHGVVRKDEYNLYTSPFIEQEKNFLWVAIQKEEELLKKAILKKNIGIEIIKSQIDGLHEKKKIIDDNHGSYDKKEERLIIQSTIPLVIRQKELNTYKDMDKEIQQIHCREIFYITMARIATYWSGVLQASKKIDDFKDIPATCVNKEDLYRQYFKDDNSRGDNNHDDEKK
ncbi:MAG: hypothetical protein HFF36_12305 [Coprobacillus sp.]|nr:hypothetical protein [Coprobacillus sp.]